MIIAYASANVDPTVSQDLVLNQESLPYSPQVVYGEGNDTDNPAATFTYAWSIVSDIGESGINITNTTAQNPTVASIDTWGNYRLFLVVTNTATGETSESDPLLAPDSAFMVIRVKSAQLDLEKPASGERNWFSAAYDWVEQLEGIGLALGDAQGLPVEAGGTSAVIELSGDKGYTINGTAGEISVTAVDSANSFDISIGLASPLTLPGGITITDESTVQSSLIVEGILWADQLRANTAPNGYIKRANDTWVMNVDNTPGEEYELLHRGFLPTETDRAGVLLEDSLGNADGKILTFETTVHSRFVDHTFHFAAGGNNPTIVHGIEAFDNGDVNSWTIASYHNHGTQDVDVDIDAFMNTGGKVGNGDEYQFRIVTATSIANLQSNTFVDTGVDLTVTRVSDGGPLHLESPSSTNVKPGQALGVLCLANPQYLGYAMKVDFIVKREIGA